MSIAVNMPCEALLAFMNNRAAYLVSKKLTGEISESEIQELNLQLMQDPDLYETISLIEVAWKTQDSQNDRAGVERLIKKLQQVEPGSFHLNEQTIISHQIGNKPSFLLSPVMKAAAVLVFLLGLWWIWKGNEQNLLPENAKDSPMNLVATKAGSRTHIVLRDGTKVWLNGDSKLTYANLFDGETREVRLSGEAYFDVAHNPDRPFIIHTEKITIRVTGTSFNVRDYPGETKAETSLITGKVEVRPVNNPRQVYYLKPNEKIVLRGLEPKVLKPLQRQAVTKADPKALDVQIVPIHFDPIDKIAIETAWMNDQLAFNDEPFRDVADKMEKWYNVSIEIRSPKLAETHLNGKFENEPLHVALEALQFSTPFKYTIEGNKIIIDKN